MKRKGKFNLKIKFEEENIINNDYNTFQDMDKTINKLRKKFK